MRRPRPHIEVNIPDGLHPATVALVQGFAAALAAKLKRSEDKYGYRDGWLTQDWEIHCRSALRDHVEKGDPLDVATYCAFLWRRGWPTSKPAPVTADT